MTGLLDTNVALYLLGGRMAAPLPAGSYGISVISEMELLSWPSLTRQEENAKPLGCWKKRAGQRILQSPPAAIWLRHSLRTIKFSKRNGRLATS
jgi:hypothetical protein